MGRLQKSFGHLTEQVVSKDDISLPLDGWSLSSLGCASFVAILFLEVITSDSSSLLQHLRTTLILSAAAGLGLSYGLIRRERKTESNPVPLDRPELFEAPVPVAPEKEIEIKEIERIIAAKCTCECDYEFKQTKPFTPRRDSGYASPDEDSEESSPIPSRSSSPAPTLARTIEDCVVLHKAQKTEELRDYELIELVLRGAVPAHSLEKALKDPLRAVKVRRSVISRTMNTRAQAALESSNLPWQDYDYSSIMGCCAENVIGFMPLPVGVAGPLIIDGKPVFLPMATTEGTLIASTSRGCKLLNTGG
ncbi:hypothetical protein LTS18_004459, partial [Coniosporium uncinatum]